MQNTEQPTTTPEPTPTTATTAPSTPPPAAPTPEATYVTYGTALLLCGFTLVITLVLTMFAPGIAQRFGINMPTTQAQPKVVYLDFERILNAGIQDTITNPQPIDDVKAAADKFQTNVGKAIRFYTDAGYVVVNFKAIIGATPGADITDDVIRRAGLTPKTPAQPVAPK